MSEPWTETCPPDAFFNGDPDIRRGEREPQPMPETCAACRWFRLMSDEDGQAVRAVLRHTPKCQGCRDEAATAIARELGVCINPSQAPFWGRVLRPDEGCELYEEGDSE